jgi:hypothetical protein
LSLGKTSDERNCAKRDGEKSQVLKHGRPHCYATADVKPLPPTCSSRI